MGLFDLFRKKAKEKPAAKGKKADAAKTSAEQSDEEKPLKIFETYFAPNEQFYTPGSPSYNAYFGAINAAVEEMAAVPQLFEQATKQKIDFLEFLVKEKIPGYTNFMLCGLLFLVGKYATVKDAVYCVDFSERVPNCIALYLLLIAQKEAPENRKQLIDAGVGTDTAILEKAITSLQVCDPDWKCTILQAGE